MRSTPAFTVNNPADVPRMFVFSTQLAPFQRSVEFSVVPVGSVASVVQLGVTPAPALTSTCPLVPALPLACSGLAVPPRLTPALTVTCPAVLDFTTDDSTHADPFQRSVLSVAVPFANKLPLVHVGVAPAP